MLDVRDLRGGYGGAEVLRGVSLKVAEKEIVTIAGTNGSGKSTMGKAVMGLLRYWTGEIEYDGLSLRDVAVHKRIRHGIFHIPQVANVFPSLTVLENLQVVKAPEAKHRLHEVMRRFPALSKRSANRAGTLSGGERQQLAIARAIVSGARLMIMDEPTANLAPQLVDQVLELIAELPKMGAGVLLIEQRAREALSISNVGYVMHLGEIVAAGTAANLLHDPKLGELFFGGIEPDVSQSASLSRDPIETER